MTQFMLEISYLLGSISFILGLKMLSHPETARKGNIIAAFGMFVAILGTILFHRNGTGETIGNIPLILLAILVGTGFGYLMAIRVKMTSMPQMVSLFNGMGGACAAIISIVEFNSNHSTSPGFLSIVFLGLAIGSISFSGSMVAYGKLDGKINDVYSKILSLTNNVLFLVIIGLILLGTYMPSVMGSSSIWLILVISLLYGILFVMPIGGADMPVVISLLNSFTGVAAAMGGFLYDNSVMLTGGILVGSAGTILTILMCNAMNRSLLNVLIGSFGKGAGAGGKGQDGEKVAKEISITDAAILCAYAQRVCIVPGYGLAVAQAQHTCHEFEKLLEAKGVDVYYAIHPVAGRMPGHMNVLLAEADVPYPKLKEMEDANPLLSNTDVAIVVGANDVVNPAAESDPASPIYGMPIINVNLSKNVIIMKRSMGKGYAGIANELFFLNRSRMLFGDAKDSLSKLIAELKEI